MRNDLANIRPIHIAAFFQAKILVRKMDQMHLYIYPSLMLEFSLLRLLIVDSHRASTLRTAMDHSGTKRTMFFRHGDTSI